MIRRFEKKIYFYLGALLSALIFLNYLGWLNPIKDISRGIFLPIFSETNKISILMNDNYLFFKDRESFFEAYREAEAIANKTEALEAENKALKQENEQLKRVLSFTESSANPVVAARVIGKSTDGTEKNILIDRGEEDGLVIGQPVIVENGILVGRVIKVEKKNSTVRLINDSQSKIAAVILNDTQSSGVVEGGYGLSVKMKFIPRNETVVVGEQIITSGLEKQTPRGLYLGKIVAVENETYQPFQEAVLTPSANLEKIFLVGVLITE